MTQFFLLGKCLFEIYEAEDVGMVDMVEGKNPEAGSASLKFTRLRTWAWLTWLRERIQRQGWSQLVE